MGKKIAIGVLGVVVIILLGSFLVPHFINWNEYKAEIAAGVKSATGRDISIGGDLSVRILPTPALTVNDFSIANTDGATNPKMVKLDALQVRVSLLPLLSGEDKKLGTAGALGLLKEKPTLPAIVMNGDILTKINFLYLLF